MSISLQSLVHSVQSYVQLHIVDYLDELRTLCAIDSGSYYKPGLDHMAQLLAERMRDMGMETTVFQQAEWGNDVLGVLKGHGKGVLLLLGHSDTVYPVGTAAQRPLRIDGKTVYGPGVCDMKGCLLSALYALDALQALHYDDFGEIRLLSVSDEEINTRHSASLMRQAFVGCDAALVLEAARANGDIVSARKGHAWYTLTARGRSAHAGVEPEKGRNAVVEIAHQILQFQSLNGWRQGVTVNAGVISGGTVPNVVPDFAQAQFDLRFLTMADKIATEERWRAMMCQVAVPGIELTLEAAPDIKGPMELTPQSLALAEQAQRISSLLGFSVNHILTGGASDASFASQYAVPVLDGLGPIGGRDHSPDEYLQIDSVPPRTALLAGLIASVDAES